MSTIIQIKRSSGSAAPSASDLLVGEMAYAQDAANNGDAGVLYIESVNSSGGAVIDAIGGKKYTSAIDAATNANTASAIVKRDASGNFSAGMITADLTGDVTGTVSSIANHDTDALGEGSSNLYFTDARVRSSVDGYLTGGTGVTVNAGQISVDTATFATTQYVDDAVAGKDHLGELSGTTDDVSEGSSNLYFTTARVDSHLSGGTGVSYSNGQISIGQDVSTNANVSFNQVTADLVGDVTGTVSDISNHNTDSLSEGSNNLYFTTARVESAVDGYVSGGVGLTYTNGTLDLDNTSVTAGSYGSGSAIPTFTVDAQGRLTAAGEVSVSTELGVAGDSGSGTIDLLNESLTVAGGTGVSTSVSGNTVTVEIGQDVSTTANVTFNDVTVDGTLYSDDITATNITVAGNLTVAGTTTTVNSTSISVTDPLIAVGNDNTATDAVDLGFFGTYHNGADKYAGMFRDASDGKFRLFKDLETAPTTTVNVSGTGYTVASLVANLEGSLTGGTVSGLSAAIAVADGGTGASSFTSNGVIFGNGSGALQATAAGTAGQVLISGGSGAAPSFGNIDGGTY